MAPREKGSALGLRVHTGWATAVLVTGSAAEPSVVVRRRLELFDPSHPASKAPYHLGLEKPGPEGEAQVRRACDAARGATLRTMSGFVEDCGGVEVVGVGVVGGSDADPARLGNPHVRAHAEEGKLYREALLDGARALGLGSATWAEKKVYAAATDVLGLSEDAIKGALAELGGGVGKPWRAEEKLAALAAWLVLAGASG